MPEPQFRSSGERETRSGSQVAELLAAAAELRDAADELSAGLQAPVACTYNPLTYAWAVHAAFVSRFGGGGRREVVLVGMNPGPWGMGQTGIPFGDPTIVKEWMQVVAPVDQPPPEARHPKREVLGFESTRREVSGTRLYTLAEEHFGGVDAFFDRFWVVNYCPLLFFDEQGRNLTPPRLRAEDRERIHAVCDRHLVRVIEQLQPSVVIGVGKYAEKRLLDALPAYGGRIGGILHPSPASPKANTGWAEHALADLAALGIHAP